ncbi:Sys1 protein [Martiniozyma asiatica (nom. inval.)]|nr:Sys1 protein [Martiniozyma asiatica]
MFNLGSASSYVSLESISRQTTTSRLLFQILVLQLFYYLSALVLFAVTCVLLGYHFSWHWLFLWNMVSLENSLGLTLIILWLLDTLLAVIFITFIIGRSKLAWDFAITIHLIHFFIVTILNGLPKNKYWWILQIISASIMVVMGTYTTRWIELRDTFFDGLSQQELGQVANPDTELSDLGQS